MFEQNLDISVISPQPLDQTPKRNQLEKDTSLEEILDEFSKPEPSPKLGSATHFTIKKASTLLINPVKRAPSLVLAADPVISSSDHGKFIKQVQIPRREKKGLTVPVIQCATTRSSVNTIHNIPETDSKATFLPLSRFSGSDSPDYKSTLTSRGGSNLLGSDVKSTSISIRRLSSPNVSGLVNSPSKIISVASPQGGLMPHAPEKELNHSPSIKLKRPDSAGNLFINSPQSARSLGKVKSIQIKINGPNQDAISGDYLARVLQKSGGSFGGSNRSNSGSQTESPRITEEYRLGKRGSFSVFKKIVEAEVVKNP